MRKLSGGRKKQKKPKDKNEEVSDSALEENERQESKNGGSRSGASSAETANRSKEKKSHKSAINEKESSSNEQSQNDDDDTEYEVENIVDHKVQDGVSMFLIKWKGYDSDNNTWEPEDTLSCPELIAKYKKGMKRSKSKADGNTPKKVKKDTTKEEAQADPNQEWEVEKVVDVAYNKDGGRSFRIRWKGYRPSSDTWEPEGNLNCKDLIEKFLKKHEKTDGDSAVPQKELREAPKRTRPFLTDTFGRRASRRNSGRIRAVYYDAE